MRRWIAALLFVMAAPAARAEMACLPGMAELGGARIIRAALKADEVLLRYIGHSTFVLESPRGVTIATDYNDYVRPSTPPVIATMNRAHDTHYTDAPPSSIRHVLRGWSEGGRARHDVTQEDVRVRNVPTNLRAYGGTEYYGNSIFVFEVAGLCIGHLGHLHHTLTPEHLKAIGQLDVVLVPVDGSFTMDLDGMIEVLKTLGAPLMIPMHYFGQSTLNRFLDRLGQSYEIRRSGMNELILSKATLPARGTVIVLPTGGR